MSAHRGLFSVLSRIISVSVIIITLSPQLWAQKDTSSNGNAFNFPFKKYGISFGNSTEFNGLRFNYADRNVKHINGMNMTMWARKFPNVYPEMTGISAGVIPTVYSMKGVNIGLLAAIVTKGSMNGVSFGGILSGAGDDNNGISTAGIYMQGGGNINGLSVTGLLTYIDGEESSVNGLSISGVSVYARKSVNGISLGGSVISKNINGFSCTIAYINGKEAFRGIGITPGFIKADDYYGLAVSGYSRTAFFHGLSIALFNRTAILHGVQLGVLNYAGNNRKGLKMLPLINVHLRK